MQASANTIGDLEARRLCRALLSGAVIPCPVEEIGGSMEEAALHAIRRGWLDRSLRLTREGRQMALHCRALRPPVRAAGLPRRSD